MKVTIDVTPEEARKIRQLNPKSMAAGTAQRTALEVLARSFEKLEEQQFQMAVDAYVNGEIIVTEAP